MALYERPLEPVNVPRSDKRQKARDDDFLRRENDYLRNRLEELQHSPPIAPPPPPPARRPMSFGDLVSWVVLFGLLALIGWLLWPIIWPDMQSTVSNQPTTQPAPTSVPAIQPPVEQQQQPEFVSLNEMSGGSERHTPIDLPAQSADTAAAAEPEIEAPQIESAPVSEVVVKPHEGKALRIEGATPVPTVVPTQAPPEEYQTSFNGHAETIAINGKCATSFRDAPMDEESIKAIAGLIESGFINAEECE